MYDKHLTTRGNYLFQSQGVFSVISYGISFIYVYGGYSAVANEYTSSSIRFFGSFSSASSLCTMHFLAASPLFILGLVFTREMRKSSAFFAGAAEGAPPPRRQPFLENRIFQTSLVLALLSAGVWMELIVRAGVLRSDPVLLYLPLGPILYCMIALYVDHSLREIARDVEDFRKMVYEAKTL